MDKKFDYTGIDILESLESAVNYNRYLLSLVVKTIGMRKNLKTGVLDFGAGTGMYANMLRKNFAITPVCLEPDEQLLKKIRKMGFPVISKASGNINDVGTVYSLNVFEHIKDDGRAARDLYKNMERGATLLIYVPAFQALYSSMDKKVEHYRRYSKKNLKDLVEKAGFNIVSLYYADPLGFFAALIYKIFDNGKGSVSPFGIKMFDTIAFPLSLLLQPLTRSFFGKNLVCIVIKGNNDVV